MRHLLRRTSECRFTLSHRRTSAGVMWERIAPVDVNRFLQECQSDAGYRGQLIHVQHLPRRAARYGHLREPLPPGVVQALAGLGVRELFTHQVAAVGGAAPLSRATPGFPGSADPVADGAQAGWCRRNPLVGHQSSVLQKLGINGVSPERSGSGHSPGWCGPTSRRARRSQRRPGKLLLQRHHAIPVGIQPHEPLFGQFLRVSLSSRLRSSGGSAVRH